ncbi:hypothetical protein PHMEG_00024338 [Phytophthora megakarya]|uniref:CCHC-type domain-containing protein n=1 Tax=Phytophthora megakarya TaxID=4795 RepID=A0A225VGF6_9STRA|nr:hypothetical protein PHMEG_00024338 [Phytophthora megakarya]
MPVSGCIEEKTCKMICLYEFQKSPNEGSENEWIAYFLQAIEPELDDYTNFDAAMKNLKMRLIFPDAASRMGQLRTDMRLFLDEYTVEQVMLERKQKKVVKYFVAALEPADFREAIQKRLEYTQYKALETVIVKYNLQRKQQFDGGRKHGATSEAASPSSSEGKTGPTANKALSKSRNGGQSRRSCLKCGSLAYLVRKCPDVTPNEMDRLLATRKTTLDSKTNTGVKRVEVVQVSGAGTVGGKSTGEPSAPVHSMVDDNGTAQATINSYTLQTSLLDSGADDMVYSLQHEPDNLTLEALDEDGDELDELVNPPSLAGKTTHAVQEALELKLQEATRNGLRSNESE